MNETLNLKLDLKGLSDRQFEGHGSVFGNVDLGGDVVARGAFKDTLKAHKANGTMPMLFWMHDPRQVPGKWLDMSEDEHGLKVKGELASTPLGEEMRALLGMKAVGALSIGYRSRVSEWHDDEERGTVRVLKDIDLWEVSIVSLAMNPLAKITGVKSRTAASGEYVPTERELERFLRAGGYSKSAVRAMCSRVYAGGMPADDATTDPGRWDAGEGDEMDAILKALQTTKPTEPSADELKTILAKLG